MFHKVVAHVADLFDSKGNEIPRGQRNYREVAMTVYSKDKSQVLSKAGRNISAREMTHDKLELVA